MEPVFDQALKAGHVGFITDTNGPGSEKRDIQAQNFDFRF